MKTCLLCTKGIKSIYKLCADCYINYNQYTKEPWFKELSKMQGKQEYIDNIESVDITTLDTKYIDISTDNYLVTRNIGRPEFDWRIVKTVLTIYDTDQNAIQLGEKVKPLSLRDIATIVANEYHPHSSPGYFTIRAILQRYRPNDYKKRRNK